jgi:hypothetical protein
MLTPFGRLLEKTFHSATVLVGMKRLYPELFVILWQDEFASVIFIEAVLFTCQPSFVLFMANTMPIKIKNVTKNAIGTRRIYFFDLKTYKG